MSDEESKCMNCGVVLTEKNVACCWESECQNARDRGEYCGDCIGDHMIFVHKKRWS